MGMGVKVSVKKVVDRGVTVNVECCHLRNPTALIFPLTRCGKQTTLIINACNSAHTHMVTDSHKTTH